MKTKHWNKMLLKYPIVQSAVMCAALRVGGADTFNCGAGVMWHVKQMLMERKLETVIQESVSFSCVTVLGNLFRLGCFLRTHFSFNFGYWNLGSRPIVSGYRSLLTSVTFYVSSALKVSFELFIKNIKIVLMEKCY